MKYNFIVEAEETSEWSSDTAVGEQDVQVKMDPEEHQDWVWAKRTEVEKGWVGKRELGITSTEQRQVILDAFAKREEFWSQKGREKNSG